MTKSVVEERSVGEQAGELSVDACWFVLTDGQHRLETGADSVPGSPTGPAASSGSARRRETNGDR